MPVECVTATVNGPSGTFDRETCALPRTGARARRPTRKAQLEHSLYIRKQLMEALDALQRITQKIFFPAMILMDVLIVRQPQPPLLSIALVNGEVGGAVR